VVNCVFRDSNPAVQGNARPAAVQIRASTFFDSPVACGGSGTGPPADEVILTDDILVSTTATAVDSGFCASHHVVAQPTPPARPNDDHVIVADPKFKDPANHDFHLLAGSPAIDAGDPAATETVDFDGNPRPVGSAVDIGAYELQP
jgi:hypothetical protein